MESSAMAFNSHQNYLLSQHKIWSTIQKIVINILHRKKHFYVAYCKLFCYFDSKSIFQFETHLYKKN